MKKLHSPESNHRAFHLLASWWSDGKFAMREGGLELTAEPFTTFPQQTNHANFVRIVTKMCCHTFYKAD